MIKVITLWRLRETGPALRRPGAKAGMALVEVPPSMFIVVSRTVTMPMQTTTVRFKSPKKGRKQNFSRNSPKEATSATDNSTDRTRFSPNSTPS